MKHTVITDSDFKGLVTELCRQIAVSNWRPDYIVGITRGGLTPAVMISHFFNIQMHSLDVSLRDSDISPESNLWMAEDAFNGKNILLIDDINDQGSTLNWIINDWALSTLRTTEYWKKNIWNKNVKVAVVVDNLSSKSEISVDFAAMEINKDENPEWLDFPYERWWK